MLSQKQLKDVCLLGAGCDECRYIDGESDDDDTGKFRYVCKKQSIERKPIDEEIKEYTEECLKNNKDPKQAGYPLGDNCKGFLPLKDLLQGYDI